MLKISVREDGFLKRFRNYHENGIVKVLMYC